MYRVQLKNDEHVSPTETAVSEKQLDFVFKFLSTGIVSFPPHLFSAATLTWETVET